MVAQIFESFVKAFFKFFLVVSMVDEISSVLAGSYIKSGEIS